MSTLPNQRVSDSERNKPEWYIPTADYIINKALSLNSASKEEVSSNLAAAEGIIDSSTYDYVIKAFGIVDKNIDIPSQVRDTSLILPIKRRYIGEFIRQYKNFQVYHKDIDAIKQRNSKLATEIEQLIAQQLVNYLNEKNLPAGAPSKPDIDIPTFIKDFQENWIDDKVIESDKILKLFDALTDAELNYIKAFYYYWATDEVYSYRRVEGQNIIKEIVPSTEYYRIPSGNMFVEDDDMGMRKYQLTFNQINEQLVDRLSESDLTYLRSIENQENVSNAKTTILNDLADLNALRDEYSYLNTLQNYSLNASNVNDLSAFTWIYHVVYKTEVKIAILTYMDSLGSIQEKIVEGSYKINKPAGDISIEYKWISRFYQQWRIGPEHIGIYTKPELIEPQRQDVNVLSKCKSPYNGITGTFDHNIRNSIAKLLKPYEALYRIYQYQRERAVSKYRVGLTIIPESLIQDSDELTRVDKLKFAKRDDTLYVNDEDLDANAAQLLRVIGNPNAERYIEVLTNLIQSIKNEAMEIADMNPQRYGDINQNSGKGTTEMAISNAQLGSILLFTLFNKFVERDKESDIDHAKVAWINGKQGTFFDKKENKIIYVEVDGEDFYNRNIGIFNSNSSINDEKLRQFRQLAYNASQNGEFAIAADAIEFESSIEIHKLIKEADAAKKALEQSMNERNAQAQEKIAADKLQSEQEQRAADKYKVDTTNATNIRVAEIQAGSNENISMMKAATDLQNESLKQEESLNELTTQK